MRSLVRIVLLSGLLVPSWASAGDLDVALEGVCEKIKTCALRQMEGAENMSEQMKQMIDAQLDTMCDFVKENYTSYAAQSHPLYEPATACLVSMGALSCERLEQGEENPTPECASLKEQVEAYK